MMALKNDKYKYVLYTIPKSACATMRQVHIAIVKEISHKEAEKVIQRTFLQPYKKFFPANQIEGYYQWAVVRNPYRRLVSCYFDKIGNPANKGFHIKNLTFKDWIKKLENDKYKLSNDHWKPCASILERADLDRFCKLENIHVEVNETLKHLGLKPLVLTNRKEGKQLYDKPFYEYYDNETIEIVKKAYSMDFKQYNYDLDINLA